jgi:hypothetical protein
MDAVSAHPGAVIERWRSMTLAAQLGNIGSEVGRAARARSLGNDQRFARSPDRALELFDATLADDRWRGRRKEIARAREVTCDFLVGDNDYGSSAESLDACFLSFAVTARKGR